LLGPDTPTLQFDIASIVAASVARIGDMDDVRDAWVRLAVALTALAPRQNLRDALLQLISVTNFTEMVEADRAVGLTALTLATRIAVVTASKVAAEQLMSNLKQLAPTLGVPQHIHGVDHGSQGSDEIDPEIDPVAAVLHIAASLATVGAKSGDASAHQFQHLYADICAEWPELGMRTRGVISRMCIELPPSEAAAIWPLLVRLRLL
jgi:hypothetical protein